ncbi:hypothetical protein EH223_14970 [candidate division KSB1 bacterium]|nr:hypothetical protein [candidate division KSB1 bacterium]RQW01466.1 MAG: hypothetical protein EH223_14970 [candidate division KSB1 bacterium]
MKKVLHLFLLIILLFAGCATFKSAIEGQYDGAIEKNFGADRVDVLFIFSHYRQTVGYDAIPKLDNQYQRISGFDDFFRDALTELSNINAYATYTEYASDVNEPERRALKDSLIATHDYVISIRFMRQKSFAKYFLGTIGSTVTLTLVPIPYHHSYSVGVEIYNSQRQLIQTYSRNSGLTKWVQALLIFIYPFHPERRKTEELYVEFLHDIFRQIESENVLKAL